MSNYQWGRRPDDWQPPSPPPVRAQPAEINGRPATPGELVVLARARAAARAAETKALFTGIGAPR